METQENSVEALALTYRETGNPDVFSQIIGNGDIQGVINRFASEKVWGYDRDDLKQEMLIEMEKVCRNYRGENKLTTVFWKYASNRIYALRQRSGYDKRKANYQSDSYERAVEAGYDIATENQFLDTELELTLGQLHLTDTENTVCRLMIAGVPKAEAARQLNVTPTTINYYLKRVHKKINEAG